jgi:hypothetical protein
MKNNANTRRPILLIEDNPLDIDLTKSAFEKRRFIYRQTGRFRQVCRSGVRDRNLLASHYDPAEVTNENSLHRRQPR